VVTLLQGRTRTLWLVETWEISVTNILVIMERYTAKERAFCVEAYFRDKSVVKVHRAFRKQFKVKSNESVPTRKSIFRWVEDFRESDD